MVVCCAALARSLPRLPSRRRTAESQHDHAKSNALCSLHLYLPFTTLTSTAFTTSLLAFLQTSSASIYIPLARRAALSEHM